MKREKERERESLSKQTRLARHVLDCRCQGVDHGPCTRYNGSVESDFVERESVRM